MAQSSDRPVAYLKRGCPFSLRLWIFLTEARLADKVSYSLFDDQDQTHRRVRAEMQEAGVVPGFPAVRFDDGTFLTGADSLIAHFASEADTDPAKLPLLSYYNDGVFRKFGEMYVEIAALKSRYESTAT